MSMKYDRSGNNGLNIFFNNNTEENYFYKQSYFAEKFILKAFQIKIKLAFRKDF